MRTSTILWACLFAVTLTSIARAADTVFDELRFGASASVQGGNSHEEGIFPDITVFFDPFGLDEANGWQQELARPRLQIGTSIGTKGSATQVFAGLSWQVDFTEKLFAEAGFGAVWHNGDLTNSSDGPDLGCRFLFHEYVGAGYRFNAHWNVTAQVAHSSHANLCDGPNSGMTRAGLQLGYKF
jgi:lipid A 3-O-deacylase